MQRGPASSGASCFCRRRGERATGRSVQRVGLLRARLLPDEHARIGFRLSGCLVEHEPATFQPHAPERDGEHLIEGFHQVELELAAHLLRDVLDVRLVLLRQNDLGDAGAAGAEDFLLDAADR